MTFRRHVINPPRDRPERLQQLLVDLAAHLFHDRERLQPSIGHAVGTVLDQRGIDIDNRDQPHDVGDFLPGETVGIA